MRTALTGWSRHSKRAALSMRSSFLFVLFRYKFIHQMLDIVQTDAADGACAGGFLYLFQSSGAGINGVLDHSVRYAHAAA